MMMPPINTLGIAVLNRGDLLLRCVESVDHPVRTLFIINNGTDPGVADVVARIEGRTIRNAGFFGNIKVERHRNLGCGPSWNRIITNSPGWWLISGNDIQFLPGSLSKVVETVEWHKDASVICAFGYSVFVLTELGRNRVGLFDENFYPAYFEDSDHFRRLTLAGAKAVGVHEFRYVHGEAPHWGSATVRSDPVLNAKNNVAYGNLLEYYSRKWGGQPGKETFARPFNKDVPLDHCPFDPELRRKNSLF